ncbi:metallophosphoesterase family protein [Microbacterium sp. XT11]|uniref:metallophosphoesterase family protein n=1 Tax=Microbacterium sp. XT11 TaxID=367477 RepID=UPI00082AD914|nr:metallophosphoesterase family protein [Microbacterium sp. XT11]
MSRRQPRTFYTSDLHFRHRRVAELRGFGEDVERHDRTIAEAWNEIVEPEDTVYVLGDVAVSDVSRALAILKALPGKKHLVSGNHDPVHPMHRRTFARWMPRFLEVFDTVSPFLRRRIGGHQVLLSHFPYAEYGEGPHRGGAEASRHDQYRLPDMGLPILHGHTHQPERYHVDVGQLGSPRPPSIGIHVGVDAWGLAPVPQEDIVAKLDEWAA